MIAQQLEKAAAGVTVSGATASAIFWQLSLSDWAVIISSTVAVIGFLVNLWLSYRREKRAAVEHVREIARAEAEHQIRMEALRGLVREVKKP